MTEPPIDLVERMHWTTVHGNQAQAIEALRAGAQEIERLRDAHEEIVKWSRAYPLTVFPEPDLWLARKLLEAGGMTLDAISADAMRHAVEQVAMISRAALGHKP